MTHTHHRRSVGKLGLHHSDPDRPQLWFHHHVDPLAAAPAVFGHEDLIGDKDWGMLGNDKVGCCAFASAAHEVMIQNSANKRVVPFTDNAVLSDYSACTGYNPVDPASDKGTNMFALYQYRKNEGVVDANGTRHKLMTFMEIQPGRVNELATAAYLFGVCGIGVYIYDWAQQQFAEGKPWEWQEGGKLEGGHAIPIVGRKANGNFVVVTWGQEQEVTPLFLQKATNTAFVGVTQDYLTGDKSPEALDSASLIADMGKLDTVN